MKSILMNVLALHASTMEPAWMTLTDINAFAWMVFSVISSRNFYGVLMKGLSLLAYSIKGDV